MLIYFYRSVVASALQQKSWEGTAELKTQHILCIEHKIQHSGYEAVHSKGMATSDLCHFFKNNNVLSTYSVPGGGQGNKKFLPLKGFNI